MSLKSSAPSFPSTAVVVNGSALAAVLFRSVVRLQVEVEICLLLPLVCKYFGYNDTGGLYRGGSFGLVDYEDEEDEAPLIPSSNKKLQPTKRPENRVSVPARSESAWTQEDDRSPKRRAVQEEVGVVKKYRPGHTPAAESKTVTRVDSDLLESGSGRESETTESLRNDQGAVDGSGGDVTGLSTSQRSEGCEGNFKCGSVVDRCEMANGGDNSPQSKTSCGKAVAGTNVAHTGGVHKEGDFLRDGVQTAQTSPG